VTLSLRPFLTLSPNPLPLVKGKGKRVRETSPLLLSAVFPHELGRLRGGEAPSFFLFPLSFKERGSGGEVQNWIGYQPEERRTTQEGSDETTQNLTKPWDFVIVLSCNSKIISTLTIG